MSYKKITACILIAVMTICMSGCGNSTTVTQLSTDTAYETQPYQEQQTGSENITEPNTEEQRSDEAAEKVLQLKIADTVVEVDWEDNESVEALRKMCEEEPLTIQMYMYGGFEQVGSIGTALPRNDVETTTASGDIVLYSGDQIVVFYGSNSWEYTRLGHITDQDTAEMEELLGNGDVTITVSMEDNK